jgi:hypothetical protein
VEAAYFFSYRKIMKKPEYIEVTVLPASGDPHKEVLPRKDFITHAGELIGGFVAATKSTRVDGQVLLVDEDGAMKQRPRNARASLHYIHTYIYGDALVLTQEDWKRALKD